MTDDELRALLAGAAPGSWRVADPDIPDVSGSEWIVACVIGTGGSAPPLPLDVAALIAAAPELAAEVLRLRRVLAVERGVESAAPIGWAGALRGLWDRVVDGQMCRVRRVDPQMWEWAWTKPRPRQDGFGPSGSEVMARGRAQTALEAMEAADAALKGGDE